MLSADVIIVGGGLAGTCAAEVLGRRGLSVILVDPQPQCPALFRAEKIEPDQVELLRKLGLFAQLLPRLRRIREIKVACDGRVFETIPIEQYGIAYGDMVNALRSQSQSAEQRIGRVEHIANSEQTQRVVLKDGNTLTSRLVVLSSGVSGELQARLGFRKTVIRKEQSVSLGFSMARSDGSAFPFDALTCYPGSNTARIDFLSLFVMGDAMRANLFTFRSNSDPWVSQFVRQPQQELERAFPSLARITGPFEVVSRVETGRVDLSRMQDEAQPGVVLIGDAFQTACPSTGMGVSKVLTDVDVLSECAPRWLATPDMSAGKIAEFYSDARKHAVDRSALEKAEYRRRAVVDSSLRWRVHRARLRLGMRLRRPVAPRAVASAWSFEGRNA
jgi:2-polyprenyl-6-methoxyphenol hydroxylase-like FAD-dependent oxidoreductase